MGDVFELQGSVLTVRLPKDLDHPVSDYVRRETDRIMDNAYICRIIFDFSDTGFMDSSGIGLLMGRFRSLGMRRGCVRLVGVNPHIDKLLHLSGVHRYLEIEKKEEEGSTKWKTPMK